jgi:anti-sigma regulatory factor (Ser/Thr protein kinase)
MTSTATLLRPAQPAAASRSRDTLTIDGRLSELTRISHWLGDLSRRWAVSDSTIFAVDLVINEVVINIISYGYADNGIGTHPITITLADTPSRVIAEIIDDGTAFNPFDAPPMDLGEDLEHAPIGGRGIPLIKSYSAEHDYLRIAGQNRLTLAIPKLD